VIAALHTWQTAFRPPLPPQRSAAEKADLITSGHFQSAGFYSRITAIDISFFRPWERSKALLLRLMVSF